MAEQGTHNPLVAGSSPAPRTRVSNPLMPFGIGGLFFILSLW